jgi:hypothetical protein
VHPNQFTLFDFRWTPYA